MTDERMCESSHVVPTAQGDQTVRCQLPADHVNADPDEHVQRGNSITGRQLPAVKHWAKQGPFPVVWD
jgi:hypothetical protein